LSFPANVITVVIGTGLIYAMMTLANPLPPDIEPVADEALVDTGSVYLVIPEHVRLQLQLEEQAKKEITLADGSRRMIPYVGPIETRFKNRVAHVGAVVMGDEVLLGVIPMEDMDLVLLPKQRLAEVNPQSPNFASAKAKRNGGMNLTLPLLRDLFARDHYHVARCPRRLKSPKVRDVLDATTVWTI
jgi:clan AA aspartic protease